MSAYQELAFQFAVCKCSFRTAKEEEEFGSYCIACWEKIKPHMKCVLCETKVEKERLYVDVQYYVPTCKSCFKKANFNKLVEAKGFKR
jgi:hypothetical protein